MNKLYFLAIAGAAASLIACNSGSSGSSKKSINETTVSSDLVDNAANGEGQASGATLSEQDLVSYSVDGVPGGDVSSLADFPELVASIDSLSVVDSMKATDAGSFDFYSGTDLVLTLSANADGQLEVTYSNAGIRADSVTYAVSEGSEQEAATSEFHIAMSQCVTEEVAQEQGQEEKKEPKEECQGIVHNLAFQGEIEQPKQEQEEKKETPDDKKDGGAQDQDDGGATGNDQEPQEPTDDPAVPAV